MWAMFNKVVFILIVFVIGCSGQSKAQMGPPDLRCIAIEDNGDITITWIPVADPLGQFVSYEIFNSINGSNFTQLAPPFTNRLQNVYPWIGANFPRPAPLKDYKFYMVTHFNDGSSKVSIHSDTLSAMELDLTLTNPNTSGTLTWNLMRAKPLGTWDAKYNLKRKLHLKPAPGTWVDNTANPNYSQTSFIDSITRCKSDVSYQIELKDASGCISKSNVASGFLEDNNGAASMTYERITVGNNGVPRLFWSKHPDGSVVSYINIYKDPNGSTVPFDTNGLSTLSWYANDYPAEDSSQCFLIAALDSCGKTNGGGRIHCTIYLSSTFDPCAGEVYLGWTPYVGWNGGVDSYEIYMSLNGDTNKIGTVNGLDSSFTVKNVNAFNDYAFYIVGKDVSGRFLSRSNLLNEKFSIPNQTKFLHLRSASVISENEVKLRVLLDRKAPLNGLKIYRAVERKGPYKYVGSRKPPGVKKDTLFDIFDTLVKPYQINYVYYVEATDTCDQPVIKSNKFRTLFLYGESNKYVMENDLKWSASISFDSSALDKDVYSLYRGVNRSYAPNPIRSLWSNTLEYLDDITEEIHKGDEFCYRLKLAQTASDTFETPDTSMSNEICFKMEPDVFIPSSFTPNQDGINESWRPRTSYIIPYDNYSLTIFDRWGKEAFKTDDPLEGWNGERNGGMASVGLYSYRLEIVTVHGSKIERKGTFHLVR